MHQLVGAVVLPIWRSPGGVDLVLGVSIGVIGAPLLNRELLRPCPLGV